MGIFSVDLVTNNSWVQLLDVDLKTKTYGTGNEPATCKSNDLRYPGIHSSTHEEGWKVIVIALGGHLGPRGAPMPFVELSAAMNGSRVGRIILTHMHHRDIAHVKDPLQGDMN
jgi:hypothetical protein